MNRKPTLSVMLMLCLIALLPGHVSVAQDAQAGFEHSPSAQAALDRYERALEQNAAVYHEQVAVVNDRFATLAQRYVQQYTTRLEQLLRELTRDGQLEGARQVQAMIDAAGQWQITPPDSEGNHFLSSVVLEADQSERATQLGIDLLVQVQRAGVTYSEQAGAIFDVYVVAVESARREYRTALDRAVAGEQRAGRFEAVQEINDAIVALNSADEIRPPDASVAGGGAGAAVQAAPFAGFYSLHYGAGRRAWNFYIELTGEGGMVHGHNTRRGGNWADVSWPIEIVAHEGDTLLIRHDHPLREMAIHEITLGEDGRPASTRLWWSMQAYRTGRDSMQGEVEVFGSPDADLMGLSDGDYVLDMRATANPRGGEVRDFDYRIQILNGVIAMTQENTTGQGGVWTELLPQVLRVQSENDTLLLTFDRRCKGDRLGIIRVHPAVRGAPTVEYWWNALEYERGAEPNLTGAMLRR